MCSSQDISTVQFTIFSRTTTTSTKTQFTYIIHNSDKNKKLQHARIGENAEYVSIAEKPSILVLFISKINNKKHYIWPQVLKQNVKNWKCDEWKRRSWVPVVAGKPKSGKERRERERERTGSFKWNVWRTRLDSLGLLWLVTHGPTTIWWWQLS